MTVHITLSCGGCDAVTEPVVLKRRFQGTHGSWGWGNPVTDTIESVVPEGWVAWDPYTYCTYCPTCWESIVGAVAGSAGVGDDTP